ncbi:unnamed protein product [Miscanthus lutarioriparius]|uniref:Uncharacterized protein n=1 Tax=Miscanthus lutarioriparius TaxID=422564 RepID=A0A811M1L3_9POAL|nr:unnamed protein product [Miscanthus lutarioriparius]
MTNHAAAAAAGAATSAVPWRSGGASRSGGAGSARHMPRRGQIKARIASAALHAVASALLKAIHSSHILVRKVYRRLQGSNAQVSGMS